jgi:BSD domain
VNLILFLGAATMTEEEFWETRIHLLGLQQAKEQQLKGISSNMVTEMKPSLSGEGTGNDSSLFTGAQSANQIKYTLTPHLIRSIFVQYPSVHKAFQENVPDKLSEKEFWTQYFQSRLFYHQQENTAKSVEATTNILDSYLLNEEVEDLKTPSREKVFSPLDLDSTIEDHPFQGLMLEDFLLDPDKKNFALMRQLNRHSERVLQSCLASKEIKAMASSTLDDPLDRLDDSQQQYFPLTIPWEEFQAKRMRCEEQPNLPVGHNYNLKLDLDKLQNGCGNIPLLNNEQLRQSMAIDARDSQQILQEFQGYLDTHEDLLVFQHKVNEVLRHFWAAFKSMSVLFKGGKKLDDSDAQKTKEKYQRMMKLVGDLRQQLELAWFKKYAFSHSILASIKQPLDRAIQDSCNFIV